MAQENRTRRAMAKDTIKGKLIDGLVMQHYGVENHAAVTMVANITDRDTITITAPATHPLGASPYRDGTTTAIKGATDTYEMVAVAVDTGTNTSAASANLKNVNPYSQITISNSKTSEDGAGEVGTILRCEDEFMQVVDVKTRHTDGSPTGIVVMRGYAGEPVSHDQNKDIHIQADTALTAGELPLPIKAVTKGTALSGNVADGINWYADQKVEYNRKRGIALYQLGDEYIPRVPVRATSDGADVVYLHNEANDEGTLTATGSISGTNNGVGDFVAGVQPLAGKTHVRMLKVTSTQATSGITYVVPFKATGVLFEDFGKAGANGSSRPVAIDTDDENIKFAAGDHGTVITIDGDACTADNFVKITAFA